MPSISMNPADRYVIQSSAYDRLLVGKPLTDRTISRRKKQGYFGNGILALKQKEKMHNKTKQSRQSRLRAILKGFDLDLS